MKFVCDRCGYGSEKASNLKHHLDRKKVCEPLLHDSKLEDIYNKYFDKPVKEFKCDFCENSFSTRQGKYQHKLICKNRIESKKREEEIEEKLIIQQKKIEELEKKINKSKRNTKIINNTVNNNTTYNTYNIQLNKFGEENISFIPLNEGINLLKINGLVDLLLKTYFHKDHPENHTIKCKSLKDDFIECYNGEKFVPLRKKKFYKIHFRNYENFLSNMMQNQYDILPKEERDKILPMKKYSNFIIDVAEPLNIRIKTQLNNDMRDLIKPDNKDEYNEMLEKLNEHMVKGTNYL